MIASLNGILDARAADHLIVDVNGVGYKVTVSLYTASRLPSLGEKIFLSIHTSVREDDISLYGFLEEEEKRIFQKLISVSGIGPKLALTILSGILPHDLVDAIAREDLGRLTTISGIGKKTAERMILDLKDKMSGLLVTQRLRTPEPGKRKLFDDALSALVNLGYNRAMVERTLTQVPLQEGVILGNVIRDALKILAEARS